MQHFDAQNSKIKERKREKHASTQIRTQALLLTYPNSSIAAHLPELKHCCSLTQTQLLLLTYPNSTIAAHLPAGLMYPQWYWFIEENRLLP